MTRPLQPHGTRARAAAGCDCGACTAADKARMPMAPAIGPARMARALVASGYPTPYLARRCEVTRPVIAALLEQDMGFIPFALADTVRALYTELRDVHPFRRELTRAQRSHAIALAGRRGWAAPEAWDGESIDDPEAEPVVEDDRSQPLIVLDEYEFFQANFGGGDRKAAAFIGIDVDALRVNVKRGRELRAAHPDLAVAA